MNTLESFIGELMELRRKAAFADTCCDKPEDRMYHAEDGTWWKRVGLNWVSAEPPEVEQ